MEKQLLPSPALAPAYDKASWMYVFRDFSGSDADRAAERVAMRLGMTSYPQHLLLDPSTLEQLADTGRQVESFLAAVNRVHVKAGGSMEPVKKRIDADARADSLATSKSAAAAAKAIDDEDIVVRLKALEILAEKDPETIAMKAPELLAVANDPFRYEVCKALAREKEGKAARPLEAVLRDAPQSLNPNVLRIESAKALAACGDAASIDVLLPYASSGEWRNGLTGIAVDAIASIAAREPKAKSAAKEALVASYPAPATDAAEVKMCEALAKRVHAALAAVTGKDRDFPAKYDDAALKKLRAAW